MTLTSMRPNFHAATRCWLAGFALFFLSVTLAHAASIAGKVVGVADGDTITVLVETNGKKESVRVRLWGIDAPEAKQAFGSRAKEELSKLVFGFPVLVEVKDKDRYGRTVGVVYTHAFDDLPPTNVNLMMVATGFAWWYRDFARTGTEAKTLEVVQSSAKAAKLGLWSEPTPVPPWEFRRTESAARKKK